MKQTDLVSDFTCFSEMLDKLRTEEDCRKYLEHTLWKGTPVCGHCGSESKDHYKLKRGAVFPPATKVMGLHTVVFMNADHTKIALKVADYIPIVSSFTNAYAIYQKRVILPELGSETIKNAMCEFS